MTEQLREALSLLKTDITCWNDAARQCEEIATKVSGKESAEYMLLCAVYRERAEMLSDALEQWTPSNRKSSDSQSVLQDS
jgi:hypothetical protein